MPDDLAAGSGAGGAPRDRAAPSPAGGGIRLGRARRGRLSRAAEFERVYRQGRSVANRWLVLYAFPRVDAGLLGAGPRLGLSVSRKVGGAVERNRVKRLLREAFDAACRDRPVDHDVVIVARPDARDLAERRGLAGVQEALDELLAKTAGATGR